MRLHPVEIVVLLLCSASMARAQSLNVDFGDAGSPPSSGYSAVGLPGAWNAIPVLPGWERAPLVNLDGSTSAAQIYTFGAVSMLANDDPLTSGDAALLLDDMVIGWNDPVDVCIWFEGLQNGNYEVITYAMTPADASLESRVRVDHSNESPVQVGGAWPGAHVEGVTYARHTITITNGEIALHSGLWAAEVQSGINGIQLHRIVPANVTEPTQSILLPRVMSISPNPARGEQHIELELGLVSGFSMVCIHDAAGRLLWQERLDPQAGRALVRWDGRARNGEQLPAGAYFLRVETQGHATRASDATLIRVR